MIKATKSKLNNIKGIVTYESIGYVFRVPQQRGYYAWDGRLRTFRGPTQGLLEAIESYGDTVRMGRP